MAAMVVSSFIIEVIKLEENYQSIFPGEEIDRGIGRILDGSVEAAVLQANASAAEARSARDEAAGARDDSKVASESAKASADSAELNSSVSKSWAVGGTGVRPGEDLDNAKYYAEIAGAAAGGGVITFNGRTGPVVPEEGDYTAQMVGAPALAVPASPGNLAALGADGSLQDSGKKVGDFAPSGFGLGEVDPLVVRDANTIGKMGFYACIDNMPTADWWYGYHIQFGAGYATQRFCRSAELVGCFAQRVCIDGVWWPWEWGNPPMLIGVEYRTTERYNGRPVYAQAALLGRTINQKTVTIAVQNIAEIVRYTAKAGASPISQTYNGVFNGIWACWVEPRIITANAIDVVINAGSAAENADTAYATFYYTKTTD